MELAGLQGSNAPRTDPATRQGYAWRALISPVLLVQLCVQRQLSGDGTSSCGAEVSLKLKS